MRTRGVAFCCALCLLPVSSWAATITAASCELADVQAAISAASPGDTVCVPAGTCAWAAPLVITKGITLQGAGIGLTNITGNTASAYDGVVTLRPDEAARLADNLMRVTGFTLDANHKAIGLVVSNNSATPVTKIRIDHNRIINAASRGVWISGTIFGVADNNTLETFYHGMDGEGTDELQWKVLDREYGTAENFYFEDNTLIMNGNGAFHAGGNGGRYVARYNTYSGNTGNMSPVFDFHGNQWPLAKGGHHGGMICEIYGNSVDLGGYQAGNYFDQRGGWALFFCNYIVTDYAQLRVREEFDDKDFPGGTNYVQKVTNSYYWNNRMSDGNALLSTIIQSDLYQRDPDTPNDPPALLENREFWNQNPSYNGTTEIGVYVGSSLPAHCTVGDGAWITTQSTTDLTGLVGPDPSTPISGTFYKCTAPDTWTEYYTPFTYPHPLRAAGQETQVPGAPKGLKALR